jgi:hypothetical protein
MEINTEDLEKFLGKKKDKETKDVKNKSLIKSKDGLLEATIIEKTVYLEDGRQLLNETLPISTTNKSFLR